MSEYTITFTLTDHQLRDIILSAHSYYWLANNYTLHVNGESLSINTDLIDGVPVINSVIGPKQIAEALQAMSVNPDHAGTFAKVMGQMQRGKCYADGPTCDNVLQVAVFGRVVFG